jgi:hypothetical protein
VLRQVVRVAGCELGVELNTFRPSPSVRHSFRYLLSFPGLHFPDLLSLLPSLSFLCPPSLLCPSGICLGCCCTNIVLEPGRNFGQNAEIIDGTDPNFMACLHRILCFIGGTHGPGPCDPCTCVLTGGYRRKMRESYHIPATAPCPCCDSCPENIQDHLLEWCCGPCSDCQMTAELIVRGRRENDLLPSAEAPLNSTITR